MRVFVFAKALIAAAMLALPISAQTSKDVSELDIAIASAVALPCIDCAWQGAWCQVCLKLPLTLAPGGTGSVPDSGLARLNASPWLRTASACIADTSTPPAERTAPESLASVAMLARADVRRMERVQACLKAVTKPAVDAGPRWTLRWDRGARALNVVNAREDAETALIIAALHDNRTDRSVEIPLDSADAVVEVAAGKTATIHLPMTARFGAGTTLEIAVTSASAITEDRGELSVLSIDLGGAE